MGVTRAYEANVAAAETVKSMATKVMKPATLSRTTDAPLVRCW